MNRTQEFIGLYNRISNHLRTLSGSERDVGFAELLRLGAEKNAVIKSYRTQLRRFGDLRNAIVHDRDYPNEVLAEPTEKTVKDFSWIVETVLAPPRLIPRFQMPARVFAIEDSLVDALSYMRSHDFSQVIVEREGQLALLTVEGIASWLEAGVESGELEIAAASVADALCFQTDDAFVVMDSSRTVYDAYEAFAAIQPEAPRIYAIIVTQNGRLTEKPLGIVTPWDLVEFAAVDGDRSL